MASIRKRTWKSRGVERTAWVLDYLDTQGKRRLQTFETKKEADAAAVTVRHEVKEGTHTPASASKTVTEATELWIADCEANELERSTVKQRKEHLKLHITPFIGREKLSTLTMPRVDQFIDELRTAGRSFAMRRKVLANLKIVLSFAQRKGLVAQNVARGLKIRNDERATATSPVAEGRDFPSRTELRTIMENATGRWRPLVITAMFTGMRASELRGLKWKSVDLEKGVITVCERADAWGKMGAPKSKAGNRDIRLVPTVVNTLREWRAACPPGELGLVFPNGDGKIESHTNIVNRFWNPIQVKHGMTVDAGRRDADDKPILEPKYGFHSLRHAAASLFIAYLKWSPKKTQTALGHSSIKMTYDLYGHLLDSLEDDTEDMKRLEAAVVAA